MEMGPPQYRTPPPVPPPMPPHYLRPINDPISSDRVGFFSPQPQASVQNPTVVHGWHQPSPPLPPPVIAPIHPLQPYSSQSSGPSPYDLPPQQIQGQQINAHIPTHPAPNLLDEDTSETISYTPQISLAPAPPRPPNPELLHLHAQVHDKLTSEIRSLSQVLALDAERLRAHQMDLLSGEPAIRDEMARLEAVRDVCRNVAGRLRGTVNQAEISIAELRRKGDPEVDELVCSTTIVHNQ
jgi:ESCRT-I complex subunit TSG101